jgi:head-tail adaptor
MAIEDFYDSSVTIQQLTSTKNPIGGLSKGYSTRISGLACRVSSKSGREADEFGKMTNRTILRLYCEATATNRAIVASDRVVHGSKTYEVTAIRNPAERNHHLEIDLIEVV